MAEPRRLKAAQTKKKVKQPKVAREKKPGKTKGDSFLKKEIRLPVMPGPMGRLLNTNVHFVPQFLKDAWSELKLVHWPNRRDTAKLTFAVLIFAVALGGLIAGVDFVIERVFKEVILP